MKKHVRAVLLILASDHEPIYQFFRRMQLAYANLNPDIKMFMTYGENISSFDPNPEWDIINPGIIDSISNERMDPNHPNPMVPMLRKTVNAIEQIDKEYTYDFLVRTNLSTLWILDRLIKTLDSLPTESCLAGSRLGYISPPFLVGTGLIVNGYMASELVRQQDKLFTPERLNCKIVGRHEDRELSEFFEKVFSADLLPLNSILNFDTLKKWDEHYMNKRVQLCDEIGFDHIRIKNDADRIGIDPYVARHLCQHYYKKDIQWDFERNVPIGR